MRSQARELIRSHVRAQTPTNSSDGDEVSPALSGQNELSSICFIWSNLLSSTLGFNFACSCRKIY